jgi:Flp pilus assembly protein TadB
MIAALRGWLAAAGALLAAIGAALLYRQGRRDREREELRRLVQGARERSHAELDAGRAADPAAELRRDWRRGL